MTTNTATETLQSIFRKIVERTSSEDWEDMDLGIRVHTDPSIVANHDVVVDFGLESPQQYKIGDEIKERSHVWRDDIPTDEQHAGLCTIGLERNGSNLLSAALLIINSYAADLDNCQIFILSGIDEGGGDDIGEVVLSSPVVEAVFGVKELSDHLS